MAAQTKTYKAGRNKAKCERYRQRNTRTRHRGAEYRVRHGIGKGKIGR